MRRSFLTSSSIATLALFAAPGVLLAQSTDQQQQQQQANQQAGQQAVAEQCLSDLQSFAETTNEEGYWVTGWGQRWGGTWGWGRTPAAGTTAPPPTTATDDQANVTGSTGGATGGTAMQPWGGGAGRSAFGTDSPRYQIRTLYSAAQVLAYQGDEQACQAVLAQLEETHDRHVSQLREAGVEPGEVVTWRQEQMAAARPASEIEQMGGFSIDDLTGTDVRNTNDEHLGSVSDVVLGANGDIAYVVIARGGFLGMGEDHVAVPWQDLQITPGVNLVVLDVPEDTLAQAPDIGEGDSGADETAFRERQEQIDAFWEERRQG